MKKHEAIHRYRFLLAAFGVLVILIFFLTSCMGGFQLWRSSRLVEAVPNERSSKDWVLVCRVTGEGDQTCDEQFSAALLHAYENRRGPIFLERDYPGTRVCAEAWVTRSGRGAADTGPYKIYGTVVSVDMWARRAVLTDCIFVPQ